MYNTDFKIMKLSTSVLVGLLVLMATVLSTGVNARRNRGLQDDMNGDDTDVVYADGPGPSPSSNSASSASSSGKGDCGADGVDCCFGDTQLCFQGLGCDLKIVDSDGKPLNPHDNMNITCTKNCGDDNMPCCYDLCPGRGAKGSKGTGEGGGKGGSKGDSSSGGDDCDCKCNPGLTYDISTKTCTKCGRCEKGKKDTITTIELSLEELDEITKRAGGGDDLQADTWLSKGPMCYPCCEGDTCDPGHVCTARGMCERCGNDLTLERGLERFGGGKFRQPCCIKEEMVRVTKKYSEDSCPPSPKAKSGWCEPEEEWVLKIVHKCNDGNVCQADGLCSRCGKFLDDPCCDSDEEDGGCASPLECGIGKVCKEPVDIDPPEPPAPSSAPSKDPSSEPSQRPSSGPSASPSSAPSKNPSESPSSLPSESPSSALDTSPPTPQCTLDIATDCTIASGPSAGQLCGAPIVGVEPCLARPTSAIMLFNGGGCEQSDNTQELKFTCSDENGGPPTTLGEEAYIVVTDKGNDITYFEGIVGVGDFFPLNDNGVRFEADQLIQISTPDRNTLLQQVQYHSSCSSNLSLKNRFGASQLVGFFNEVQGNVTCFVPFEFDVNIVVPITISGTSVTVTKLVAETNFAGTIDLTDQVAGVEAAPGGTVEATFQSTLDLTSRQTNTLMLSFEGILNPGGALCQVMETMTFETGVPDP